MRDGIEYHLWREPLPGGEVTTVYAVRYPARSTCTRVVYFPQPEHLDVWCRGNGVEEGVVGGFFLRDPYRPLGELWLDGRPVRHEPVADPHGPRRGTILVEGSDRTSSQHQWTILERGSSMMSLAPASLRAGISVLIVAFSTTVSTA